MIESVFNRNQSSGSSSSSSSSFWWGVATALGSVYVYHKVVSSYSSWQQEERSSERARTTTTQTTTRNGTTHLPNNKTKNKPKDDAVIDRNEDPAEQVPLLLDRPDLDLRLIRKAEAVLQGRTSTLMLVIERCTNDHNYSAILRTAEALGVQHCGIIDPPPIQIMEEDDDDGDERDEGTATTSTMSAKAQNMKRQTLTHLTPHESNERRQHRLFAQNATEWLTVTEFATVGECVATLRDQQGYHLWVTDLSQQAVPLTHEYFGDDDGHADNGNNNNPKRIPFPPKLALVMGTEAVGCSQEMLEAADCRVYLPLRGFADSLNLSVATALVVQQVLFLSSQSQSQTSQNQGTNQQHHPYVARMPKHERQALREQWFPKLARQRLLTSREKKERKRLQQLVRQCRALLQQQQQQSSTNQQQPPLTPEQLQKIAQLPLYAQQLAAIDQKLETAHAAVADLIQHPPTPLTDLRRADDHRVTFVGRNTKAQHAQHWQSMPATAAPRSLDMATAAYFRRNVSSQKKGEDVVGVVGKDTDEEEEGYHAADDDDNGTAAAASS